VVSGLLALRSPSTVRARAGAAPQGVAWVGSAALPFRAPQRSKLR
jgi:hypothetical protein